MADCIEAGGTPHKCCVVMRPMANPMLDEHNCPSKDEKSE